MIKLAKTCGWVLPHKGICWVSERHSVLNRDERGRLHSLNAPAVMYPDGWAIHAVHGVRVPGWIVERPQEITASKIEAENNAEIRRIMLDRFGWSRYLINSGAKEVSRDERGILFRKQIPSDEDLVMVKVRNSTPEPDGTFKDYFLRVPPTMQTAWEAVAWTFSKDKNDYNPTKES